MSSLAVGDTRDTNAARANGSNYAPRFRSKDITQEFTNASKALGTGQLIKDEDFTLFESVSALEIMDPKMDSGYIAPGEDTIIDDFDPLFYQLPEEIIGIIDQLLCLETAWHAGYPLSQTVFTSLHMNNLLSIDQKPLSQLFFRSRRRRSMGEDTLADVVLRPFCLGMAKSCDPVIQEIISEHYYEEEDFLTNTFSQDLLTTISVEEVCQLLLDAVNTLRQRRLPEAMERAICHRLEMRAHLLKALEGWQTGIDADTAADWRAVLDSLPRIESSHDLSKEVPKVFTDRVQRYLTSSTPPRPMIETPWAEAMKQLRSTCEDTVEAYRLQEVCQSFNPSTIMRFAWSLSSRKPQPSTYSRAVMQRLLFRDGAVAGIFPHTDLLVSDMRDLVMAGDAMFDPTNWEIELPSSPRYQVARKVDGFMAQAMEARSEYLNLYRMVLQNRCRIRRTFAQSIAILDNLQSIAEEADSDIIHLTISHPDKFGRSEPPNFYALSAWVFHHKLGIMEKTVQLGFELEIYLPEEIAGMYSFLHEIAETRTAHLGHIASVLAKRQQRLTREGQIALASEVETSRVNITVLSTRATATSAMARALTLVFSLLQATGLIASLPKPYSQPALRHELRMKPFLPVGTPDIPSLEQSRASTYPAATEQIATLCDEADRRIKTAKVELQKIKDTDPVAGRYTGSEVSWKKEVQALQMTAIATGIAVAGIRDQCKRVGVRIVGDLDREAMREELTSKVKVELPAPEDRYDRWWVVPKLLKK